MNPELNHERVIKNPQDFQKRQLPPLRLGPFPREPAFKHPSPQQVLDPPQSHLPLLLHRLVIIRADEDPTSAPLPGAEQLALRHQPEQPVPVRHVVAVGQLSHLARVESETIGELGRGVVEAGRGREGG